MTVGWPAGIRSAGVACGIKPDGSTDLGAIVAERPIAWAGTFTRNAAAAAPVVWCRSALGRPARALVVNSGNANACTGAAGEIAVGAVASAAAARLGCPTEEVLVASTGPIGLPLDTVAIERALPRLLDDLDSDPDAFSRAILTTDTRPKLVAGAAGDATLVGVAKGAAMLAPNMATMLAFLVTDAALGPDSLQSVLQGAVARTFDRICVDACESTNDSVFLFTTGTVSGVDERVLAEAVEAACCSLAEQMVRDAEGGSKLVRIVVRGASDETIAASLGRAVAASALWRAAVHGADPNWGRIVAALGAADRSLDVGRLDVSIGAEPVFVGGAPAGTLGDAAKEMAGDVVDVCCVVGDGPGHAQVLSSDLSPEYVALNAYGTT